MEKIVELPTYKEIDKRLKEAKEALENQRMAFANPGKVVGELMTLQIGPTDEVWELISKLIEEIRPRDYKGACPPLKSYEAKIKNHNLLTSFQIIAYRKEVGMSQSAFARYLAVGEASIKRWETYYVQDASQDELIRLKCDKVAAEINFLSVHWKRDEPNIYSGHVKFNLQLFKNVALYLVEHTKESILYLNKLHFYIDFYHFKTYGMSLTGARYTPLQLGPCPDQYGPIYETLVKSGCLKKGKNHSYETVIQSDPSLFEDREKETLEFIVKLYQDLGPQKILSTSHEEEAYKKTEEGAFISYQSARNLRILKKP